MAMEIYLEERRQNPVSAEENKAVVRRFLEGIFSQGNPEVVDELADPDFVVHDPSSEAGDVDAQGVKESIAWSHNAFPELRVTIEDQVAEGDKVATRWRVSGTHQGEMMGAAPTGNQVTFAGTQTDYLSGGKIVESWSNWDTLGMLRQIGAIPAPER
jgi:predicted ester cyclase